MTKEELTKRRNKAFQNIEEVKIALSLDEQYIDELEEKIADIKANCNYVLEGKDVEIMELKEKLAQTIENDEVTYETLKLHDKEEIAMRDSRIKQLEEEKCELLGIIQGKDTIIKRLQKLAEDKKE